MPHWTQYESFRRRSLQPITWLILTNKTVQENTDKQTQYKSEKVNNLKYIKTKLPWFSCLLQHSVRKRGGLILLRSRAHTGLLSMKKLLKKCVSSIFIQCQSHFGLTFKFNICPWHSNHHCCTRVEKYGAVPLIRWGKTKKIKSKSEKLKNTVRSRIQRSTAIEV